MKEQIRSEALLRHDRDELARFKYFFDLSVDMLCIAGTDGYFKHVNSAFDALGYTREELLSKPFIEFIHPDDQASTLGEIEKLSKGISTIHFENRYCRKDGVYRCFSWTSKPEAGVLYATARDITDAKQVEADLRKSEADLRKSEADLRKSEADLRKSEADLRKSEADLRKSEADLQNKNVVLEEAIRSRDEMVGVISHELKNPLSALQMGTLLIQRLLPQDDPKLERVLKLVEKLKPTTQRMNQLISDLLDVTRLESKALSLEPRDCDLFGIVQNVITSQEAIALNKLVELKSNIQPECRSTYCDPDRTLQVLINLVNNGIKFTNAGGVVSILAEKRGQEIEVRVADTGKGISKEHLPHVFDRFWQAKETAYKGTGLGLSIAQGLIEAQGGKIWAESQIGAGTTFYFTLPIARTGNIALRNLAAS